MCADRILTWYLPEITGDGTSQGIAYCMEKGYSLPARVRLYAHKAPEGGDLIIDIKTDGESIFGTYKGVSLDTSNTLSRIEYHTLSGTFQNNEALTESSGSATGTVIDIMGNIGSMKLIRDGIVDFTVADTINGTSSGASGVTDAFVPGLIHTFTNPTIGNNYAILVDGSNKEENAGNFAKDKTKLDQFSWVTLDVIQSGGAKGITVQLELDAEYTQKPDEEEI